MEGDMMLEKIMEFAKNDDRVSWVVLNGSRAHHFGVEDKYQDWDIELGISSVEAMLSDMQFLDAFGPVLIQQRPESMKLFKPSLEGRYTILTQFVDGTRLDLCLTPCDKVYPLEKGYKVLLDKDEKFSSLNRPVEDFWQKEVLLDDAVNEFLCLSFYVVKGSKRGEITYAMKHLDYMREMVLTVYAWLDGNNPGAHFKYLEKRLADSVKEALYRSYDNQDPKASMLVLFDLLKDGLKRFDFDLNQFEIIQSIQQSDGY